MTDELVKCPFCEEKGFDAVGLKSHLLRWCEEFEHVMSPEEESELRRLASESGGKR